MILTRKMFMARFITAMQSDSAALFIGAGLCLRSFSTNSKTVRLTTNSFSLLSSR